MSLPRVASAVATLAVVLLAGANPAAAQRDIELPDIGSSANSIITPEQERMIGADMYRSLRRAERVLDDPQLADWLETVGFRLAAQSDRPDLDYTFFMVRSPQINAFAAPGGYIGLHAGLVVTAESEDEVAAVLAHEIAHVTQRHIVRAVERMQTVSLPILLGTLGALIAAQSAGSSDAAQAAIVGGTALMQQQAINFTRHNEYEADRIGIQTLARAGYDPQAMGTFFWRMQRALRGDGQGVPEFLRTHPVTTTRISEARNRAERIRRHPGPEAHEPHRFLLVRERARVLGGSEPSQLVAFYRRAVESEPEQPPVHARYGLGLALTRAGRAAEAVPILAQLVDEQPDSVILALALAEAESMSGRHDAALARLERLNGKHGGNRAIGIAYAEMLVATGRPGPARDAVEVLRPLLGASPRNALLQLTFARASELSGDLVRAGEAHAEVAMIDGRFDDALAQLNALLRRPDVDYYQRARIEARIAEVTPIALEQRRRANLATTPPPAAGPVTGRQ
jgi:predicted Zn-dependent protease